MCIGKKPKAPAPVVVQTRAPTDPEIERQRNELMAKQVKLQEEQVKFQQNQSALAEQNAALAKQLAERPEPAPAPPPAIVATGGTAQFDGTVAEDNSQDALNSRKKGRKALRIDLAAGNASSGGTGLNIPVG